MRLSDASIDWLRHNTRALHACLRAHFNERDHLVYLWCVAELQRVND